MALRRKSREFAYQMLYQWEMRHESPAEIEAGFWRGVKAAPGTREFANELLEASVARADLMKWVPGAHASTFGGNPVACAAALVTIELLERELIDNAARMGAHLMARLRDWPARFPIVGDVRGLGLMLGIELVRDQQSKTRAPELRDRVVDLAFERGLLILGAGDNSLRLCPALIVTRDHLSFRSGAVWSDAAEVMRATVTRPSRTTRKGGARA